MSTAKYWVAVISKEHAIKALSGSFIQVCHGKQSSLNRMKKGDHLLIYSSKLTLEGTEKCQAFTAVGRVKDNEVYEFKITENFKPYRRDIEFLECAETSIISLINDLDFITNKKSWSYPFRFGFFEIKEKDFTLITAAIPQKEMRFTVPYSKNLINE